MLLLSFIFYFYLVDYLSNYATNKFKTNLQQQTLLVHYFHNKFSGYYWLAKYFQFCRKVNH